MFGSIFPDDIFFCGIPKGFITSRPRPVPYLPCENTNRMARLHSNTSC